MSVLQNIHGGSFFFSRECFYMKSSSDGLSNSVDKVINDGSSPVPGRDRSVDHDLLFGVFVATTLTNGLVHVAVEAPFVRVKLLLQNQGELIRYGRLPTPYKGITNCFTRTIKNDGMISLWRGNSAKVFRILPDQILDVVFNVAFKSLVYSFKREGDS